ncbi:MAG: aminopeptidase P family protein [Lachnospiraceae bacterium]|nr:aminopeptidase P family protein [Lachnospiraceae bacterium]
MEIPKRIKKLRERMKKEGVSAYYIPTCDFHFSEYVSPYFRVREYFSGFTGSAGELLITDREAMLWTDGRYFIQAERELEGSGIKLMRSGAEGVPDIFTYLKDNMSKKSVLGFDGRTVDIKTAEKFKKCVVKLAYKEDLTSEIFERPPFPSSVIEDLTVEITGRDTAEKLGEIRQKLKETGASSIFISRLDDIAYILNIRGDDIPCNPVVLSYLFITDEKAYLFTGNGKADIAYQGIIIKPYSEIKGFLSSGTIGKKVCIEPSSTCYLHYKLIKKRAEIICKPSPVSMMKAVKNDTEISRLKDIYLKDSLALTRFIRWLGENGAGKSETEAAEKLREFRKEIPEFRGLSFETISAYGENAAIIHYSPKENDCAVIEEKGLYMVDSGGQYMGGTTDVTRTIVMGNITKDEREAFTLVAAGMLEILNCVFAKGCMGYELDILARKDLWKKGFEYRHGTGHGVGYMLSVHEGPCAIREKALEGDVPLEPGMIISDEPGVYREGRFGVRTENILLVKQEKSTEDGTFYSFESLTKVPIDDRGIDRELLSDRQREYYDNYQKEVYEALSPFLSSEEALWLKKYSGLHN